MTALNAAKTDAPLAPVTAPPTDAAQTPAPDKPKRTRKEDLFSRKARNVPSYLLTMGIPFDYTKAEAIALAKVAHTLQKPEQLVLSDCLRWAFDQYMGTTFVPHIAAYDALPLDQQTAKLPKEPYTRSRSLSAKIAAMTNADDIRALLQKKRAAADKLRREADEILAQMEAQANAQLDVM